VETSILVGKFEYMDMEMNVLNVRWIILPVNG
jgi:hypothetical protein